MHVYQTGIELPGAHQPDSQCCWCCDIEFDLRKSGWLAHAFEFHYADRDSSSFDANLASATSALLFLLTTVGGMVLHVFSQRMLKS
jgi:hypothetical protein